MSYATLPQIPAEVAGRWDIGFRPVTRLDNGGAPCPVCQMEGCVITVQMYAYSYGEPVFLECGEPCIGRALAEEDVDGCFDVIAEVAA